MNINLLRLFRHAEARLRESDLFLELQGKRVSSRAIRRRSLPYQYLAELPIWLRRRKGVYIPNIGSPVGKSAIAEREIGSAVFEDTPEIALSNVPQKNRQMCRTVRVLLRLPRATMVAAWLKWKHPNLSPYRRSLLVGLDAMGRFLKRHPQLHPLVISDVSPLLAMLALAAHHEGNRGIWWQDDYHHLAAPLFPFGFGCFLNQVALDNAVAGGRVSRAYRRPVQEPKPGRALGNNPAVGVAVNVSFGGSEDDWRVLAALRDALQADVLHLRLHPNSTLAAVPVPWIKVADRLETMVAFARRIDLAVVGNSASQLHLLTEGVPVLHLGGLDPQGFDLYGYVNEGLLPGADGASRVSLEAIRRFYESSGYFEKLQRRVGFANLCGTSGLDALVSIVAPGLCTSRLPSSPSSGKLGMDDSLN